MRMHSAHLPKACVERLYLPRGKGGRNLINVRDALEKEVSGLRSYIDKAGEPPLQNVSEVQHLKDDETIHSRNESIAEGESQETEINFRWLVSGELKIKASKL